MAQFVYVSINARAVYSVSQTLSILGVFRILFKINRVGKIFRKASLKVHSNLIEVNCVK